MSKGSPLRQFAKVAMTALLPRRRFMASGPRSGCSLCLTFDDGPHPEHTRRLLDVLKELGVPGTFFLIGKNVERYPDVVRRIVAEGHAIGHHTFHHLPSHSVSAPAMMREVNQTDRLFQDIVGVGSRLFRPPNGKLTLAKLGRVWMSGRTTVLWNVDPKDGRGKRKEELLEFFRRRPVSGGDIVLLHDDRPHPAEIVPAIVNDALERGLSFVTPLQWISSGSGAVALGANPPIAARPTRPGTT